MQSSLDCLMEAKAAREVVRDTIVKTLRRSGVAEEIFALLKADELATEALQIAQCAFSKSLEGTDS